MLNDSFFSLCEDVSPHNNPTKSTVGKAINDFASTIAKAKYAFGKKGEKLGQSGAD